MAGGAPCRLDTPAEIAAFALNHFLDLVFMMDIVVTFHVAYKGAYQGARARQLHAPWSQARVDDESSFAVARAVPQTARTGIHTPPYIHDTYTTVLSKWYH